MDLHPGRLTAGTYSHGPHDLERKMIFPTFMRTCAKAVNLQVGNPIGSMGLVYIPTWMVDFYGKCR